MNADKIGDVVRYHRKKSGLTQKELAVLAGVGKTTVFDIEKGKPSVRVDMLFKVLGSLNINLELHSPIMANLMPGGRTK